MNGLPYYPAYPRDFLEGTVGMSFELKGAYRLVLDLIYLQNGNLPDDARYISGLLGCSVRKWTTLRGELLALGKIYLKDGSPPTISNYRADKVLIMSRKFQDNQREKASKARQNNDLQKPRVSHTDTESETYNNPPITPLLELVGDLPEKHVAEVIAEAWNRMAGEHGLPKAMKVDNARKATWERRVKEAGGCRAIIAAIEAIPESDLLCGRIKGRDGREPFKASLDWIAKPANWKKLAEGNYHGGRLPRPRETTGETREQMLARQMAMREKMNGAIR